MPLTPKERQHLKGLAHKLKPVIMVGNNGVTPALNKEVDRALDDHELIKIRVLSTDREERRQILAEICAAQSAEMVQNIGAIGVLYRINQEKRDQEEQKAKKAKKALKDKKEKKAKTAKRAKRVER